MEILSPYYALTTFSWATCGAAAQSRKGLRVSPVLKNAEPMFSIWAHYTYTFRRRAPDPDISAKQMDELFIGRTGKLLGNTAH